MKKSEFGPCATVRDTLYSVHPLHESGTAHLSWARAEIPGLFLFPPNPNASRKFPFAAEPIVPEGQMRIAQGFSLGWRLARRFRPGGTADGVPGRVSAVPPGREPDSTRNPTLKRWAIVGMPLRDKSRLNLRKTLPLNPA